MLEVRRSWLAWGLGVTVVVVVWLDLSPSDVANNLIPVPLFVGVVGCGLLARRWWGRALVLGSTEFGTRAVHKLLGAVPSDPRAPHTWPQVASLLVLNLPVIMVAGVARWFSGGRARTGQRAVG